MTAELLITALIAVLGSSGMWAYLDSRKKEKVADKGRDDAERRLIIAIARNELVTLALGYIKAGNISLEQADALTALYEPYKELHGNGNAERLYKQAINLPVRHSREAERENEHA